MIPAPEFLEQHYEGQVLLDLCDFHVKTRGLGGREAEELCREFVLTLWPTELEQIENLCFITTKTAELSRLRLNRVQKQFYEEVIEASRREGVPIRAIILKARQLGFSTFIECWQWLQTWKHRRRNALVVSYDVDSTEELFAKARLCHETCHAQLDMEKDRGTLMTAKAPHLSQFRAITAGRDNLGRSYTFHHLHCSENPMWQDQVTPLVGATQSVPNHPDTSIFHESTARGAQGQFYEDWQAAKQGLSKFIPFFAPWFWDPLYSMPFPSDDHRKVFGRSLSETEKRLAAQHNLTLEQLNWRRWCIANNCRGNERTFRQEYPSTPMEAFLTSGFPVFNAERVHEMAERTTRPLWVGNLLLERDLTALETPGGFE